MSKKTIIIVLVIGAAVGGYFYWKKKKSTPPDLSKEGSGNNSSTNTQTSSVKPNWKAGDSLTAAKDTKGWLTVPKTWENYSAGDTIGTFRSIAPDPNIPTKMWVLYTNKTGRFAQIELPNVK